MLDSLSIFAIPDPVNHSSSLVLHPIGILAFNYFILFYFLLICSHRSDLDHTCTIIKMAESTIPESSKCPLVFLGQTGLKVSNICLGTLTFGKSTVVSIPTVIVDWPDLYDLFWLLVTSSGVHLEGCVHF